LGREIADFGRTLGEELLEPTALYTRACLDLIAGLGADVHAFAHITGGGLAANLARVVPVGRDAIVHRDTWTVPPVFTVLREAGGVPWSDAERTWNLGIGMVAIVAPESVDQAVATLADAGHRAWPMGEVQPTGAVPAGSAIVQGTKGVRGGRVALTGAYRT
jgi:phosphoribosylformylglycinamidine cyclo-ligase